MHAQRTLGITLSAVLVLTIPTLAGAAETFPAPLAEALTSTEAGSIMRLDWQALLQHPVVRSAVELDAALPGASSSPVSYVVGSAVDSIDRLQLPPGAIDVVWFAEPTGNPGPWLHLQIDASQLAAALAAAGWQLQPGPDEPQVWILVGDKEEPPWLDEALADIEDASERELLRQEMRESTIRSLPHLIHCGEDWLLALPHGYYYEALDDACGGPERELTEPLSFPRDVLLNDDTSTLAAVAIDIPGNEAATARAEQSEIEALRAQLRALEREERQIRAQLGDMSLVLSELDGALALDLVARRADGGGTAETARFLEMLLLGARLTVAPSAPDLERALAGARIEVAGDEVHASCTVSQLVLVDAIEGDARRRVLANELRRRIAELEPGD